MQRVKKYYARNECGEISVEFAELPGAAVSDQCLISVNNASQHRKPFGIIPQGDIPLMPCLSVSASEIQFLPQL